MPPGQERPPQQPRASSTKRPAWPARALRSARGATTTLLFWLGAITVAAGVGGWALFHSIRGVPAVPPAPAIDVSITPFPTSVTVRSYLTRVSSQNTWMSLDVFGTFSASTHLKWDIDVSHLSGVICTGRNQKYAPDEQFLNPRPAVDVHKHVVPHEYEIIGTSAIPGPTNENSLPFIYVQICWTKSPPVTQSGSYVAAQVPQIVTSQPQGTEARSLQLPNGGLSDYVVEGGLAPATESASIWTWTGDLSTSLTDQSDDSISVVAASLPKIQHDNNVTFLAGVITGVAGGALIGAITELFSRAKRVGRSDQNEEPVPTGRPPS